MADRIEPTTIVGNASLFHADCRDVLRSLPDNSIDSVVTDPPYALVSIVKRFGKPGSAPVKIDDPEKSGCIKAAYARASAGFMGKSWDTGEVAFSEEFWAEVLRVLKPGGHVVAFSGTRTYHRMAVAIEDAGFEIRDQLGWVYGSGFPKSHNQHGDWEGWGTALKPAWEPIALARKPLTGTVAANLAAWGVGALNVDGCRVATDETVTNHARSGDAKVLFGASKAHETHQSAGQVLGRWPANIVHDGSDEVLACFPDTKSGSRKAGEYGLMGYHGADAAPMPSVDGDSGSAARFFYCAKASRKDRDEGLEDAKEQATARGNQAQAALKRGETITRDEVTNGFATTYMRKNTHPTVKPTELMQWLCRLVTPPGGTILDPFMGSGSTGKAALLEGFRFIGCEREDEYMPIAQARIAAALRPVAKPSKAANDNVATNDLFSAAGAAHG